MSALKQIQGICGGDGVDNKQGKPRGGRGAGCWSRQDAEEH